MAKSAARVSIGLARAAVWTLALAFSAAAAARTFPLPAARPVMSVEIPDSMNPGPTPDGAEASANGGAVRVAVHFFASADRDAATEAAMTALLRAGVKPDPATRRVAPLRLDGFDAMKIDYEGVDPNGKSLITLIVAAAPNAAGVVAVCYWGDDEAQELVGNDLQSIAESLQSVK